LYVSDTKFSPRPVWLWPNLLSLDAPLIAVLWLHLFAVSGRIALAPGVTLVLALVVWLIYIADRLLDGARDRGAVSARHRFYRVHGKAFALLLAGLLAVTCWICLSLDYRTLRGGALLALIIGAYFALVHWLRRDQRSRFPKELVVAILFGIGTFFPAWIHLRHETFAMAITGALFILICWLNTALIEYSEWIRLRYASADAPHASTIIAGRHLLGIGIGLAALTSWMTMLGSFRLELPVLAAIALSALLLAMLGYFWRHLAINAVRVLADVTLLTPCLVLLLWRR
jgi:hypothetical protein